ncbi:hypothetical protein ACFL31_01420 [Candidatus Margulisiibacteriota bacterium]
MTVNGVRRLTVVQQASRNQQHKVGGLGGKRLAVEVHGPKGIEMRAVEVLKNLPALLAMRGVEVKFFTPLGVELDPTALVGKDAKQIDVMASEVDKLSRAAVDRESKIELPEMIDHSELPFKVAKGVATGEQIAALVLAGYKIEGHNERELNGIIADESRAGQGTGYISLLDGRKLAEELNRQNPGRKFRVPTEAELLKLNREVSNQLTDTDFWIWTETETKEDSGVFVLRRLFNGGRDDCDPGLRYSDLAVRLVEDK